MKVHIEPRDFGRVYDVYFVTGVPGGERLIRPVSIDNGDVQWSTEPLPEGTVAAASMRISRDMYDALKEAMRETKVTVDDEMLRRLKLEESRVDRMMTYLMEGTH